MIVNLFIFILGLIIGSFLNVCIYRLPIEKSIIFPRSFCPKCKKTIKSYENIPIISYFLLRGKCPNCHNIINLRYLAVEVITAVSFVFLYNLYLFWPLLFLFNAIFVCFLIINFFTDIETQIIPNEPVYFIIIIGLFYNFIKATFTSSIIGLILGFCILYIIGFLGRLVYKKEVLGGGDIKLVAGFGAFLGWENLLVALFLGYLIGALIAISLLLAKKKNMQDYIPFAPALVLGAFIALLWGEKLITFYCIAKPI